MTSPALAIQPRRRVRSRLLVAAALLLSLLGVLTFLMIVFQPFADAAGGCGGG